MLSNRILVYSNDSSIVNTILRIARKSRIYATSVGNINELLKNIKRKKYLAVFFDYKDLNNSDELLQKLNNINKEVFIVLITSSKKYKEASDALDGNIIGVLKRPLDNAEIKRIINRLNCIKYVVRNTTRNMIDIGGTLRRRTYLDAGSIENTSMEKLVEVKLKKVIEKLNLDNLKGFYNIVMEEMEKPLFKVILESVNWNQIKAARILGINRNTLSKKLKQYNIKK